MSVKTYSMKGLGNDALSANFKVGEFACKDGSDAVLIDDRLVAFLQALRNYYKKPVKINSGYRTPAYNKKVGGASASYHTKGQAADIVISGVKPADIAKIAQTMGVLGLGEYSTFNHIDTRTSKSFWYSDKQYKRTTFGGYAAPMGNVKNGQRGTGVYWLQIMLKCRGYDCGTADGIFGTKTNEKVRAFQADKKLAVDGIAGVNTIAALKI